MVNLDQVQVADLEIALGFSYSTSEAVIKNDLRSDVRQDWCLEPGQPRGKRFGLRRPRRPGMPHSQAVGADESSRASGVRERRHPGSLRDA
jgi:hypothetical protein